MSSGEAAERIAAELRRRGLAAPARLLLDAHRPLAPLIGDAATALGPLLGAVLGRRGDSVTRLLEDDDGLDGIVEQLDERGDSAEVPCPARPS